MIGPREEWEVPGERGPGHFMRLLDAAMRSVSPARIRERGRDRRVVDRMDWDIPLLTEGERMLYVRLLSEDTRGNR